MPTYRISVVDHDFSACNEYDLPSLHAAGRQGIQAAIAIGAQEIDSGNPFFGAEVRIAVGAKTVGRFLVSVGASPLK